MKSEQIIERAKKLNLDVVVVQLPASDRCYLLPLTDKAKQAYPGHYSFRAEYSDSVTDRMRERGLTYRWRAELCEG